MISTRSGILCSGASVLISEQVRKTRPCISRVGTLRRWDEICARQCTHPIGESPAKSYFFIGSSFRVRTTGIRKLSWWHLSQVDTFVPSPACGYLPVRLDADTMYSHWILTPAMMGAQESGQEADGATVFVTHTYRHT